MKNSISAALNALQKGKMVILTDNTNRENEGDLVMAAEYVTPEAINFMRLSTSGIICLSLTENDFQRLRIPMMTTNNRSSHQTPFGVAIEAAQGVSTGVSAHDRAHTIKVAANPESTHHDIVMPGHIYPLCAKPAGVLQRAGHTEGGIDLMRMANLNTAAVICEITNPDGSMARAQALDAFSKQHQIPLISIQEIISYRIQHETLIKLKAETRLPISKLGIFTLQIYQNTFDHVEHIVLLKEPFTDNPFVRIHSQCITGDVFNSERCECGSQLNFALTMLNKSGGILIYLQQEGRGIGLVNKIKAYALQEKGLDTIEANEKLGFSEDHRDYGMAAQILKILGKKQIQLITNNPNKILQLEKYGVTITNRIPIEIKPSSHNLNYQLTKRNKMGHLLTTYLGE